MELAKIVKAQGQIKETHYKEFDKLRKKIVEDVVAWKYTALET